MEKSAFRRIAAIVALLICALVGGGPVTAADSHRLEKSVVGECALWSDENLVAWCIVPFDARARNSEERAAMLARLGFKHFAYDWRDVHLSTFDWEIAAMQRHGIEITACWFPTRLNAKAEQILSAIERHGIRPQLWVTGSGDPVSTVAEHMERVKSEAARLKPILERAARAGCSVALYNHGGWFGDPDNQLAVIEQLRQEGFGPIRMVYNFHHARGRLADFPEVWAKIAAYVDTVNLNGMDPAKPGSIRFLGENGGQEIEMLRVIEQSGWRGRVGLLNHRTDLDAEEGLRQNKAGLQQLVARLHSASLP